VTGRDSQFPIVQSLLERLVAEDIPRSRQASIDFYRESVRQDIENLLNTKRTVRPAPKGYKEVQASLYHYGFPDVTSLSADRHDTKAKLKKEIEETLGLFEPRLSEVHITSEATKKGGMKHLRFLIEGLLRLQFEDKEYVSYNMEFQVSTCQFSVK